MKIPFGKLVSRPAIAIVFSYVGDSEEVSDLMQNISHGTRAYFLNADGLEGFLVQSLIIDILQKDYEGGALKEVLKNIEVDMKAML